MQASRDHNQPKEQWNLQPDHPNMPNILRGLRMMRRVFPPTSELHGARSTLRNSSNVPHKMLAARSPRHQARNRSHRERRRIAPDRRLRVEASKTSSTRIPPYESGFPPPPTVSAAKGKLDDQTLDSIDFGKIGEKSGARKQTFENQNFIGFAGIVRKQKLDVQKLDASR